MSVTRDEVIAALKRVSRLPQGDNIVDAGLVRQVDIAGGEVRVKLQRPRRCACTYAFVLAVLAEREISKLAGVEKVKVDVILG